MAKHSLSLEAPNVLNTCILRVIDTSVYSPLVPTECPLLEVTAPGFWQAARITTLLPGFTVNLTACDLGIQTTNCDNYLNNLSDGIYIIKRSLSPSDQVFVEYNHLRITAALNLYSKILCCLDLANCDPDNETTERIKEAQFCRTLLDVAKARVEFCHEPKHGMDI